MPLTTVILISRKIETKKLELWESKNVNNAVNLLRFGNINWQCLVQKKKKQ